MPTLEWIGKDKVINHHQEQILGRILRQPHTRKMGKAALNMSYVLTSSKDFKETLDGIVRGLNSAGFSGKDCRVATEEEKPGYQIPEYHQMSVLREGTSTYGDSDAQPPAEELLQEEFLSFDPQLLSKTLRERSLENSAGSGQQEVVTGASAMIAIAEKEGASFNAALQQNELHNRTMHISGTFQAETKLHDPINGPINDPIKLTVREQQLLQLLRESPELTRRELAGKLGCSDSTVKRELQILSEQGILRRIGSRKTGVWVINR